MTTNIKCNLKKAHPIIAKDEIEIREYIKEYLSKHFQNKRPKLIVNHKLFIKSLLSSIEFKKGSQLLLQKKSNINYKIKKQNNNLKNEILKTKKIIDKEKVKRSSSYSNYKEEKDNLYNIKSNKKFIKVNAEDKKNENEKENGSFQNQNKLFLLAKNFRKINKNKNSHFFHSSKDSNNNKNNQNILLLSPKRNSENFTEHYKSMNNSNITDKSFKSIKSINSVKSIKNNKSIESFLKENIFKKIKDNSHLKNIYRNEKKIDENEKKFMNINRTHFRKKSPKQEYLRFLEKKSLALRANYIMNNIQDNRGGKQELRSLYNPLHV
jgi:hypothetical protein